MDLKNKTVLVAGTGISGIGATELLGAVGAKVVLYDSNEALKEKEILSRLDRPVDNVKVITGELLPEVMATLDLAVLSPGVPVDAPFVKAMASRGIKIWGEIELAWHYGKGTVAAITGTNGKTTTTALTGQIMEAWRPSVFVVGNI